MYQALIQEKIAEYLSQNGVENTLGLIQLQKTRKEFEGDLTLVVFPLVKVLKSSPEQIANSIGDFLSNSLPFVAGYNIVKGFLNISFTKEWWIARLNEINSLPSFGKAPSSGKTYLVEYSSPNTNKPLHLGHLRNNFLGYSVSKILEANGHEVIKTQIINDRGIHICKSMLAWQKFGNGETPENSNLKGDKLVGKYYVAFDKVYKSEKESLITQGIPEADAEKKAPIILEVQEMLRKWETGDKEVNRIWQMMNQWVYSGFETTYREMGVSFDKLYYESDTYLLGKKIVEEGLKKGVFYRKEDGSVWIDLTEDKLDHKLLLRGDGTSVYITQDIGTAVERYKDFPNMNGMIYTVGNEQDYHFQVLFAVLKKLGYSWANECFHLSYGMVDLPSGKMKSREGTVVDADDLMCEVSAEAKAMTQERGHLEGMSDPEKEQLYKTIGIGGLKYFLLKVQPQKRMMFNPQESIDLNGHTGPFIQYGYARIQSVMRKSGFQKTTISTAVELLPIEIELIKTINEYPAITEEAGKTFNPALVANYAYELIKLYNSFYQSVPILKEENDAVMQFRLQLSKTTAEIAKSAMSLLGIQVPERM
ncbi:MAG: arginine--tRNA ligase [Flavobacteriales bacterium]